MISARAIDYDAVPLGRMTGHVLDSWAWAFLTVVLVTGQGLDLDEARDVVVLVRETRIAEGTP